MRDPATSLREVGLRRLTRLRIGVAVLAVALGAGFTNLAANAHPGRKGKNRAVPQPTGSNRPQTEAAAPESPLPPLHESDLGRPAGEGRQGPSEGDDQQGPPADQAPQQSVPPPVQDVQPPPQAPQPSDGGGGGASSGGS